MSSRVCTECGAAADEAADRCESCGALLKSEKLHADSDVRVEHERLDEALPNDPSLPADRWGRVSDHPMPRLDEASSEVQTLAMAPATYPADEPNSLPDAETSQTLTLAQPAASSIDQEPSTRIATGNHAPVAPSPELSNLLVNDISVTVANGAAAARLAHPDARSTNTTGTHAVQPRRPPVLASEALQRDLAPPRPARGALRIWSPLLGVLGAAAVWRMTDGRGMGLPLAGAFGGLALLGLPPRPSVGRAAAVSTVAATGLALVLWSGGSEVALPMTLLTLAIGLLASGLYLRAWHRASIVARMTVTAGVLTGATYLR